MFIVGRTGTLCTLRSFFGLCRPFLLLLSLLILLLYFALQKLRLSDNLCLLVITLLSQQLVLSPLPLYHSSKLITQEEAHRLSSFQPPLALTASLGADLIYQTEQLGIFL